MYPVKRKTIINTPLLKINEVRIAYSKLSKEKRLPSEVADKSEMVCMSCEVAEDIIALINFGIP